MTGSPYTALSASGFTSGAKSKINLNRGLLGGRNFQAANESVDPGKIISLKPKSNMRPHTCQPNARLVITSRHTAVFIGFMVH